MDALSVDPVDILAFGPHPDDIEVGIGGVVAKHAARGHRVGLCDLTAGELGSNGTVEQRLAEGEAARAVLGAAWRVNLRLPDRAINSDREHIRVVTGVIRRARPRVVAAPYWSDRHPDHVNACTLIVEAVLNAGLRRYEAGGEAWKVQRLCHYFLNEAAAPSFLVDVSDQYELKQRALACHSTQFSSQALATRPNVTRFLQLIESRDAHFGAQIGVAHAEGLVTKRLPVASDLIDGLT